MPPHYGGMNISKTPYSAPFVAILQTNPVSGERLAVLDAQLTPKAMTGTSCCRSALLKPVMVDTFYVASSHWQLDGQIAAVLIVCAKALGQDILIDDNYQSQNGHSAPALTPGRGAGASSLFVILGEVAGIELA